MYDGASASRECSEDGGWGAVVGDTCVLARCPAFVGLGGTVEVDMAAIGESKRVCADGEMGQMATCGDDGAWALSDLRCIVYCESDAGWPRTKAMSNDTLVTVPCGDRFLGAQTRSCSSQGQWGTADRSACAQLPTKEQCTSMCTAAGKVLRRQERPDDCVNQCYEGKLDLTALTASIKDAEKSVAADLATVSTERDGLDAEIAAMGEIRANATKAVAYYPREASYYAVEIWYKAVDIKWEANDVRLPHAPPPPPPPAHFFRNHDHVF